MIKKRHLKLVVKKFVPATFRSAESKDCSSKFLINAQNKNALLIADGIKEASNKFTSSQTSNFLKKTAIDIGLFVVKTIIASSIVLVIINATFFITNYYSGPFAQVIKFPKHLFELKTSEAQPPINVNVINSSSPPRWSLETYLLIINGAKYNLFLNKIRNVKELHRNFFCHERHVGNSAIVQIGFSGMSIYSSGDFEISSPEAKNLVDLVHRFLLLAELPKPGFANFPDFDISVKLLGYSDQELISNDIPDPIVYSLDETYSCNDGTIWLIDGQGRLNRGEEKKLGCLRGAKIQKFLESMGYESSFIKYSLYGFHSMSDRNVVIELKIDSADSQVNYNNLFCD